MAAICAATCEADPGRDKYPKSVAANDKTTIIYVYSFASKLFPGLCLSLPLYYPSVRLSVCLSVTRSRARACSLFFLLATTAVRKKCARRCIQAHEASIAEKLNGVIRTHCYSSIIYRRLACCFAARFSACKLTSRRRCRPFAFPWRQRTCGLREREEWFWFQKATLPPATW